MSRPYRVLLVAPVAKLVDALTAWLAPAGHEVTVVSTFSEAKARLGEHPDLLMTAVKLGEYNGLHLALRAAGEHIPVVVIGPVDPVLARDAQQMGATYLSSTLLRRDLLALVRRLCTQESRRGITGRLRRGGHRRIGLRTPVAAA